MKTASSIRVTGDQGGRMPISSGAVWKVPEEYAALLRLLAVFFREEPSPDILQTMRSPAMYKALTEAGMRLNEEFFTSELEQLAESLAVEFANLFLLPGSLISPHESVQVKGGSGLLRGPETACVKEYYEYVGFQMDEDCHMEADHVSIELEFMAHLAEEEASALKAGDDSKARDAVRYQDDFLCRHLGKWIFGFLSRIEQKTGSDFYREVVRLTYALLHRQHQISLDRATR